MTAVYAQVRGSHEAAGIADEEDCCSSILLRYTELAKHVLRRPVTLALRILLEQRFHHGCHDVAW